MKTPRTATLASCLLLVLAAVSPAPAWATASVERYALIAGANFGGQDRAELRYAVSDARSFARVLLSLGGVEPENQILLEQPSAGELEVALDQLRQRIAVTQRVGQALRTEVLVYYSGHADEKGLLLGNDRYSYRSLRGHMEEIPADVRLAVLDACASGAITRLKGGKQRQPFLVDASSDMRGHAFLTSSSANEAAQESDHIGGSFFTHYLISGLRGAADVTGEGKVTLNEAYQFAFNETLGRTAETQAGAQHPAYDINLSGTGDVVITDLRQTSAGLALNEDLSGRCFVRDAQQQLVVELAKPAGRRVELGLEPGDYEVRCQDEARAGVCNTTLADGRQTLLTPSDFSPTDLDETVSRGSYVYRAPVGVLNGRHRFELHIGYQSSEGNGVSSQASSVTNSVGTSHLAAGGGYYYWIRPNVAVGLSSTSLASGTTHTVTIGSVSNEVTSVNSVLLTGRYDFQPPEPRLRPYLSLGLGPYFGSGVVNQTKGTTVVNQVGTRIAFGGYLGAGLDVQLTRFLMLGARLGTNLVSDFSSPLGGQSNYSNVEAGISISFLLGKGSPPAR